MFVVLHIILLRLYTSLRVVWWFLVECLSEVEVDIFWVAANFGPFRATATLLAPHTAY